MHPVGQRVIAVFNYPVWGDTDKMEPNSSGVRHNAHICKQTLTSVYSVWLSELFFRIILKYFNGQNLIEVEKVF